MTSSSFRHRRRTVAATHVADYAIRESKGAPRRLILLLHGFTQDGAGMLRRCESVLSAPELEDALVLAPCGPYPMPRQAPARSERSFDVGYSWYFYDVHRDEYFIDMEVAIRYLEALIADLGARDLPATVVGFSQGGYLAPFLTSALPRLEHVIGIAAQYLKGEVPEPVSFRMDAIHGTDDEVVPFAPSERAHAEFIASGARGDFVAIPRAGHRIDDEVLKALARLLRAGGA